MQYRSTKVTDNTTVSSTSSLFYGVLIVVGAAGGGGATLPVNIKVYDATSATNQIGEFINPEPESSKLYRSLNIVCKTGLRIECSAWTNVTVYVLHAWGVIHGN